jgi:tetratricopeptide (TPR) repeat protein
MIRAEYTRRQLVRMLRLKPRQLEQWQRRGWFPRRERYEWRDLLRARALRQVEAAVRPLALECSLEAARERVPELADPLAEAALGVFAGRVELRFQGLCMDALSGQLRLPLGDGDAPGRELRIDAPTAARPQEEAEEWFALGLSLEGEPELRPQAAEAYHRCLDLDPNFTGAHINLGTLHYHEKDFVLAERCYRAALALDPDYALAHFNLGNVLDETGRLQEAVAAYSAAVRLVPDYADAHYNLALAFQRLGQPRRAVPHWQRYLGLDRQSPWATHARAQLKHALQRDGLKIIGVAPPRKHDSA